MFHLNIRETLKKPCAIAVNAEFMQMLKERMTKTSLILKKLALNMGLRQRNISLLIALKQMKFLYDSAPARSKTAASLCPEV